jgi:hypothetical protein
MKYIKKYENMLKYKKFLLISGDNVYFDDYPDKKKFYIVKFIEESKEPPFANMLSVKFIFGYNDDNDFGTITKGHFYLYKHKINILYQSDKLYDCKKC